MDQHFDAYWELVRKGEFDEALDLVLGKSYDQLSPYYFLVNFVDAATHFSLLEAVVSNDFKLKAMPDKTYLALTEWETDYLNAVFDGDTSKLTPGIKEWVESERAEVFLDPSKIAQALNEAPYYYRTMLSKQIQLTQGWLRFKQAKPEYAEVILDMPFSMKKPWYPHAEPAEGWVFDTVISLLQQMQFPEVVERLSTQEQPVYVLELYPEQQFLTQGIQNAPISFDLYKVAKMQLFNAQEQRLGIARSAGHREYQAVKNWFDLHKWFPVTGRMSAGELPDLFALKLQGLAERRFEKKIIAKEKKLKIAHVVPQIVDGKSHAPSNLLESLITLHNSELFDLSLIVSSERLMLHLLEYPYQFVDATSSLIIGASRIQLFKDKGIQMEILDHRQTFENCSIQIAELLKAQDIDVVIFHGPDVVNTMCATITNVPLKILFEHGSIPPYEGFDLALVSSEEIIDAFKEHFDHIKTSCKCLPFAVDVESQWSKEIFSPEELGLPSNTKIITTISNHLDDRLSDEMCLAIAEILQRVPNAIYAPMGMVKNEAQFIEYFKQHGVADRIFFLGPVVYPGNIVRTMHLYLNEFPFGGCLSILEAMAAGCPVVTFCDSTGPQQARYGGQYMGTDHAITTCDRKEYVHLACRLLLDDAFYEEWSTYTKNRYRQFSDVKGYVQAFEKVIQEACSQASK